MSDGMGLSPLDNNDKTRPAGRGGHRWLGPVVQFIVPVALTVLLVWWLFKKVNFSDMVAIIRDGCDIWWIILAMLLSIVSHIIRAARWRLQLTSMDIHAPFMALCCSIFGCYALNLVFPRLGELWRCTYISSREKAPFTKVFGSMMSDRLSDTLSVLTLLLLTFIVAHDAIMAFLTKYPVGIGILNIISNPLVWVSLVGAVIIVAALIRIFSGSRLVIKCREWCAQLWYGFATVARMRGRGLFLLYTVLLWACYYTQLYVAFFAFPFTADLCRESSLAFGLQPCLVAFVLSAIGMAIPSNGGLGPWNIAVMFGLALYGISDAEGTAFSIIQWSGQTVMLILLGIFTMGYIAKSKLRIKD